MLIQAEVSVLMLLNKSQLFIGISSDYVQKHGTQLVRSTSCALYLAPLDGPTTPTVTAPFTNTFTSIVAQTSPAAHFFLIYL